eukprot:6231451-Prymnesium_polylepis.1
MILIVKGGAAWRHTELIDGSHSEMARTSAYGELVNSVVLCKRQYEQRGTCVSHPGTTRACTERVLEGQNG